MPAWAPVGVCYRVCYNIGPGFVASRPAERDPLALFSAGLGIPTADVQERDDGGQSRDVAGRGRDGRSNVRRSLRLPRLGICRAWWPAGSLGLGALAGPGILGCRDPRRWCPARARGGARRRSEALPASAARRVYNFERCCSRTQMHTTKHLPSVVDGWIGQDRGTFAQVRRGCPLRD